MPKLYGNPEKNYVAEELRKNLSSVHADNADMLEFLHPFNSLTGWLRDYSNNLTELVKWDEVPERFLTHLGANIGFPFPDEKTATVAQRRNLLKWAMWILKRKGTIAALEKVFDILQFEEMILNIQDRDFSNLVVAESNWVNIDLFVMGNLTDLTVASSAADESCKLQEAGFAGFVVGSTYKITYDYNDVSGVFEFRTAVAGGDVIGALVDGIAQTLEFTCTVTQPELFVVATTSGDQGDVDNIHVHEVDRTHVTSTFPAWVPIITNLHKIVDRQEVIANSFTEDFNAPLSNWDQPLSLPQGHWRLVSNKLVGLGDGLETSLDDKNGVLFDDTKDVYRIQVKYNQTGASSGDGYWGFYLRYVDAGNWIRLVINQDATNDLLVLESNVASSYTTTTLRQLSGSGGFFTDLGLVDADYLTGEHTLWAFIDHTTDKWTAGIDNYCVVRDFTSVIADAAFTKKGLYVSTLIEIEFDDFELLELNDNQHARLFDTTFIKRTIDVDLLISEDFEFDKLDYVDSVLSELTPFGVTLNITPKEMISYYGNREFSDGLNWFNINLASFSRVDQLTLVGSAASQECELQTAGFTGFTSGKTYRIIYDYTGGITKFQFQTTAGAQTIGTLINGTQQTMSFKASSTTATLEISTQGATPWECKIYNVSVKEYK